MSRSVKSVNAFVVSSRPCAYRSARPRNSSYSPIPGCATISRHRGCLASTRAIGSGPVCWPGAGPEPQCLRSRPPIHRAPDQSFSPFSRPVCHSAGSLQGPGAPWSSQVRTRQKYARSERSAPPP